MAYKSLMSLVGNNVFYLLSAPEVIYKMWLYAKQQLLLCKANWPTSQLDWLWNTMPHLTKSCLRYFSVYFQFPQDLTTSCVVGSHIPLNYAKSFFFPKIHIHFRSFSFSSEVEGECHKGTASKFHFMYCCL